MIIFDEIEYSKNLIEFKISDEVNQRTMNYVAKYFYHIKNLRGVKLEEKLVQWCIQKDQFFNKNINFNFERINNAVRYAENNKFRILKNIVITRNELNFIKKLNNYTYEKIVFCMLVSAKFSQYNTTRVKKKKNITEREQDNALFYFYDLKEAINLAGVKMSNNDRNKMLFPMNQHIYPTISGKFKILFYDPDDKSDPLIFINDYSNVVKYYTDWKEDKIRYCSNCGNMLLSKHLKTKYCDECRENCYKNRHIKYNKKRV